MPESTAQPLKGCVKQVKHNIKKPLYFLEQNINPGIISNNNI